MRQNNQRRRGRNNNRRGGGNSSSRVFDSNGPDVKVRGTPNTIYDKYMALAHDAQSSGNRIAYESYLQHAEHYYRLVQAGKPSEEEVVAADPVNGEANGEASNGTRRRGRLAEGDSEKGDASREMAQKGDEKGAEIEKKA